MFFFVSVGGARFADFVLCSCSCFEPKLLPLLFSGGIFACYDKVLFLPVDPSDYASGEILCNSYRAKKYVMFCGFLHYVYSTRVSELALLKKVSGQCCRISLCTTIEKVV